MSKVSHLIRLNFLNNYQCCYSLNSLSTTLSLSTPAISTSAMSSVIVHLCNLQPCNILRFHPQSKSTPAISVNTTVARFLTFNRWRTVVSGTWKYDDPSLNMSHEGAAQVWPVQPRVVIFPCLTNDCVSYVLSSDQLQESWITCKLKSFSPLYLHDLNTQARRVIFSVSKTLWFWS